MREEWCLCRRDAWICVICIGDVLLREICIETAVTSNATIKARVDSPHRDDQVLSRIREAVVSSSLILIYVCLY